MSKHTPDPKRLIDCIFVKRLERRLGRALTEEEKDGCDDPIHFCFPDGHIETIKIPVLRFPHDVISMPGEQGSTLMDEERKLSYERFYEEESTLQSANADQRGAA